MARTRATVASALTVVCLFTGSFASGTVTAATPPDETFITTETAGPVMPSPGGSAVDAITEESSPDVTNGWRLENDPSNCINSNPQPNCGYKPQDAGERGGALQITLFFVLLGALGVIFTVIFRNVVRRDRAIAAQLLRSDASSASPGPSADGDSPRG